jgi:hypothetical protein
MVRFLSALLVVLMLSVYATAGEHFDRGAIRVVSIIRLIASPEQYHGKRVNVKGFLRLEFEGNAIYFHREDYLNSLRSNAVELIVPDPKVFLKYDQQYVLVEGTFMQCDDTRFYCAFSGHIEEIVRIQPWKFQRE